MKLYLVTAGEKHKWVGSLAACTETKKVYAAEGVKRRDISVLDVEVPTTKQGLLEFLNEGVFKPS